MTRAATGALVAALAAAAGAAAWIATCAASGEREAFDSPAYFALALPALAVASGCLGYAAPSRAGAIALAAAAGQCAAMLVRSGEIGSLFPLGLVFMLLLALPNYAAARLGKWLRLRRASG